MKLLLKNGSLIGSGNELKLQNILIEDGRIIEISPQTKDAEKVIDLKGKLLMPGLVDVHVHFREPGFIEKETISSGSRQWDVADLQLCVRCQTQIQYLTHVKNMRKC